MTGRISLTTTQAEILTNLASLVLESTKAPEVASLMNKSIDLLSNPALTLSEDCANTVRKAMRNGISILNGDTSNKSIRVAIASCKAAQKDENMWAVFGEAAQTFRKIKDFQAIRYIDIWFGAATMLIDLKIDQHIK